MPFGLGKPKFLRYLEKNPDTATIVVAGSYGRKSAIRALGMVLGEKFSVSFGVGGDKKANIIILDYESAQEFPDFQATLVVVTACRDEAEAQKYFAVANRAKAAIVNRSDIAQEYIEKYLTNQTTVSYGDELPADYYFENHDSSIEGQTGDIVNMNGEHFPVQLKILGEHNVRPVVMACAVGRFFDMEREEVLRAANNLTPLNGRMAPAHGINGSYVIDDSADGTPLSHYYGIRAICSMDASSRIIVTNDPSKLENEKFELLTEALILADQVPQQVPEHFKYFTDELSLEEYLGEHVEEGSIVLLEIPLPAIIGKYLWQ